MRTIGILPGAVRGADPTAAVWTMALLLAALSGSAQAQVALGRDVAAPVAPLGAVTVPDVNALGLLDVSGRRSGRAASPSSLVDHPLALD